MFETTTSRGLRRGWPVAAAAAALALTLTSCANAVVPAGNQASNGADASIHDMLPDSVKKTGQLTIATDPTYGPPCEFYENEGSKTMIGFEVELWNAVAKKMGVEAKPAALSFDSLIPSVQSGRYDMAMECLTDSETRQKSGDFVDMFYSEVGFLTMSDNPKKVSEDPLTVCGLNVATVTGTDVSKYVPDILDKKCLAAGKPATVPTEFPSSAQVLLALRSGRVDVTLKSVSQSQYMIRETKAPYAIFRTDSLPRKYSGPMFNKDNKALSEAWLAGVKAIQKDGQYQAIMDKWGLNGLELNDPGINLATARPLVAPK